MKIIKKIFFIIIISLFYNNVSSEITIKYKIGNEIISNVDIEDEIKYLLFIKPEINELPSNQINNLARNSLIKHIIKKNELDKIFKNVNNEKLLEKTKVNIYKFKKVNNEEELKLLLKRKKINYENFNQKLKYEILWNELIFKKFNDLVKIDKDYLKNKLIIRNKNNKKFEYNLSEILFDLDKSENLKKKNEEILKSIKNNGFKTSVARFSIANSAKNGGEIGWIKETILSNKFSKILSTMKLGEVSIPIKYSTGYLLLRINNKREINQIFNIEEQLRELIKYEKNKQLNQFSLLFFKRLKQNTVINEY